MSTIRLNPIHVDWVGLGWTPMIGWVGWIFFNQPWWVGLKKLLNPTQPDSYTPLEASYKFYKENAKRYNFFTKKIYINVLIVGPEPIRIGYNKNL